MLTARRPTCLSTKRFWADQIHLSSQASGANLYLRKGWSSGSQSTVCSFLKLKLSGSRHPQTMPLSSKSAGLSCRNCTASPSFACCVRPKAKMSWRDAGFEGLGRPALICTQSAWLHRLLPVTSYRTVIPAKHKSHGRPYFSFGMPNHIRWLPGICRKVAWQLTPRRLRQDDLTARVWTRWSPAKDSSNVLTERSDMSDMSDMSTLDCTLQGDLPLSKLASQKSASLMKRFDSTECGNRDLVFKSSQAHTNLKPDTSGTGLSLWQTLCWMLHSLLPVLWCSQLFGSWTHEAFSVQRPGIVSLHMGGHSSKEGARSYQMNCIPSRSSSQQLSEPD